MTAGSHIVIGIAAWALAAPRLGLPAAGPAPFALAAFGALLPDIDHPRSWVGRRMPLVSRPFAALAGHRGISHSLLAVLVGLMALGSEGIARWIAWPLSVGYLSHLAADLLTPAGLRLLWPLRQTYALPICRTGSWREATLVVALVIALGLLWLGPARPGR